MIGATENTLVMRCISSREIAPTHEYPPGTRCEVFCVQDDTGQHYRWRLVNPKRPKHKLANTPFYMGHPEVQKF